MLYVLYRAIKRQRGSLGDFWSDFALGENPQLPQLRDTIMWTGISMFDDQAKAVNFAKRYSQGRFVAELKIDTDHDDVVVAKTGMDPSHYSVMGTPATLRSLISGKPVPII